MGNYIINGKSFPVLERVTTAHIPLVGLRQMDDERFNELAVQSNIDYFTAVMGRPPVDAQEAVDYVNKLLGRETA